MLRGLYGWPAFLPEEGEGSAVDWIFMGTPGQGTAVHVSRLVWESCRGGGRSALEPNLIKWPTMGSAPIGSRYNEIGGVK